MRYAIINFTRLGDLLQSQTTIGALKDQGHTVSLICLPQFSAATDFIAELDEVSIFPGAEILKNIHTNWIEAYATINNWIDGYQEKSPYDCVLNLTPSMACRVFASLLSQKANVPIHGFGLDKLGFNYNSSPWTTYVQAVSTQRNCSPYNLIDAFRSMLSLPPKPYKLSLPPITNSPLKEELNKNSLAINSELIGFQLGASDAIRQWSLENFVELGELIWNEKKLIPVLLGTQSEQKLADEFSSLAKERNFPFINLCGKTSLPELGDALAKLKALVSNDTGTLHLACGLNIPVLGIYLATAQVWDTGPYNQGNLCLEPKLDCHPCDFKAVCPHNYRCHSFISAQTVYKCLNYLVQDFPAHQNISLNYNLQEVRVWESYFDEDGFINYRSLSGEQNERVFWLLCQRVLYKNLILSLEKKDNRVQLTFEMLDSPELKIFINRITEFINRLISLLLLAKEQANMLNLRPSQKAQELLLATMQRIELYLKQESNFKAFLLLWKNFLQENSSNLNQTFEFLEIVQTELENFLKILKQYQ